jgi:PleD family two-component response regulator
MDFLRSRQYYFGKDQKVELETILEKLEQKEREFISTLIEKDPLTGVYNRRKLDNDI